MTDHGMVEVLLVDGFGNAKIHAIVKQHISPVKIEWPHPDKGEDGAQVQAVFYRSNNEYDCEGRQVYRQHQYGAPPIREQYLLVREIERKRKENKKESA